MKILSMTATFGQLDQKTLDLTPNLNIIEAPNEWGKSTWCAFMVAMLYGISTKEQTKTGFLAVKEHYAPWSGKAMSGRMDLLWNGRKITIERSSTGKGKIPFGVFRAYETDSGMDVPELTGDNCGEMLLGVERSVFQRAGFLKLTDLPVGADEALRRRLNSLVTTGDESDTADTLKETLKNLKNACYSSKKKGLIPQAEEQKQKIQTTIQQIDDLLAQKQQLIEQQEHLQAQRRDLENHRQALQYQANLTYTQKIAAAQVAKDTAEQTFHQAQAACEALPSPDTLQADTTRLQALQEQRSTIHTKAQMLPPIPAAPETSDVFRGMTPDEAITAAQQDAAQAAQLQKQSNTFPVAIAPVIVGALMPIMIQDTIAKIAGIALAAVGITLLTVQLSRKKKAQNTLTALIAKYRGAELSTWELSAKAYADARRSYEKDLAAHELSTKAINDAFAENEAATRAITGNLSAAEYLQNCNNAKEKYRQLEDARTQYARADEFLQALSSSQKLVAPPQYEDHLTLTEEETQTQLRTTDAETQHLQQLLGSCQGQMETLGDRELLQKQLEQLDQRLEKLADVSAALELAQTALEEATLELQRRFAPRISKRAQELFGKLTNSRYDHLLLDSNFIVHTRAENETTSHDPLWRSDGTVDQLYLALRLAVAEELTPDAPIILDDALVRFDDVRLAAALKILKQTAQNKQVILFTCQSREKNLIG